MEAGRSQAGKSYFRLTYVIGENHLMAGMGASSEALLFQQHNANSP